MTWHLCRLALAVTAGLWAVLGVALALAGVCAAPVLLFLVALALFYFRRPSLPAGGWAFGTARPESTGELLASGHLRPAGGLLLGTLPVPSLREAATLLLTAPVSESEAACRHFLDAVFRRRPWLKLQVRHHLLAVCPTGGGKTTSIIVPQLLTDPTTSVVVDMKDGEIASLTLLRRAREFGHRIVVLDPWHLVTNSPDTLNPLAHLNRFDPRSLDDLAALSSDLVVREPLERERHWNDGATKFIRACAAWVLLKGRPGVKDLQTVAELMSSPAELHTAARLMQESDGWGGMLRRLGGQLGHYVDRDRGSTLTTACRHLDFLSTPCVAESTTSSSFDPRELRDSNRPTTVYLVMPAQYAHSHAGLMRMWLGTLLRACYSGGVGSHGPVRFYIDEAASLGHQQSITDAVQTGRGYSIGLSFVYQSLGQLKLCFPDGQDQTFLSNMDCQVYFGPPNDWDTASRLSEMIGDTTVQVVQQTGGTSRTKNRDPQGLETSSAASNDGWSVSETGRRLLRPEEILTLPERTAIVLSRTTKPIFTRLVRYYERAFRGAPGLWPRRRDRAWAWCLALFVATLALMVALYAARPVPPKAAPRPQPWPPPEPVWVPEPPLAPVWVPPPNTPRRW